MTIITLIHGTWARGAPWTKDASPLAKSLKERIGGDVRIERFVWSGRNLHCSRRRAASNLQKHIRSTKDAFPAARHFIIAHSHGGMVALYALADKEIRSCISAVICLATPFIITRARSYPEGARAVFLVLYICGIIPLTAVISDYLPSWYPTQGPLLFLPALIVVVFSILSVRALLAWCVLGNLRGDFDSIRRRVIESFSLPSLSSNQLLILRAAGDEASGILTTSAFASWVVGVLSRLIQSIFRVGTMFSNTAEKMITWAAPRSGSRPTFKQFLIVYPLWIASTAAIALVSIYFVLVIPLLFLCVVFSIPFGIDAALAAVVVEFEAEITPIGKVPVVSLNAPTAKGLWHSLPYNDPQSFEEIVQWITFTERKMTD